VIGMVKRHRIWRKTPPPRRVAFDFRGLEELGICMDLLEHLGPADVLSFRGSSSELQDLQILESADFWIRSCLEVGIVCTGLELGLLRRIYRVASHFAGETWTLDAKSAAQFVQSGEAALRLWNGGVRVSFASCEGERRELREVVEILRGQIDPGWLRGCYKFYVTESQRLDGTTIQMDFLCEDGQVITCSGMPEIEASWEDQEFALLVSAMTTGFLEDGVEQPPLSMFLVDHKQPDMEKGIQMPFDNHLGTICGCSPDSNGLMEIPQDFMSVVHSLCEGKPVRALLVQTAKAKRIKMRK